jgi:uncharacterized membrane protein YdbT with pleckstrin-like domain
MNEKVYNAAMFRSRPFTFIIGCFFLFPPLYWFLLSKSEKLTVSNGRITYSKGLLSKNEIECDLKRVSSVQVKQSIGQRIFGAGDVVVNTAGDIPEIEALGFANPNEIKKAIDSERS